MPDFPATIEAGKLVIAETTRQSMSGWSRAQRDGAIVVTLKRQSRPRTDRQNANYWANLQRAGEFLGYSAQQLHDALGDRFRTDRSGPIAVLSHTGNMTTAEFATYLDAGVIPLLAEYGYEWQFEQDNEPKPTTIEEAQA